jgi:hypothetical protein
MHYKWKFPVGLFLLIFLNAAISTKAETLTIPVTKDSGYDWRGWFSTDYGSIYVSSSAKAHFYSDILSQITVPGKTTLIHSATFNYKVGSYWENALPYTLQAFRIANDWNEATGPLPGYGEGYGSYSGSQLTGWFSMDVKNLVEAWVDGTYPNYGVMLTDTASYASQGIFSRESEEANRPYFLIDYSFESGPWEVDVGRGHRILIQKGLQIQALAFPWVTQSQTGFSMSRFNQSKFTGLNFWECEYPTDLISTPPGPQWGRWTTETGKMELTSDEQPYLQNMVSFQYWDEPDIINHPELVPVMHDWFATTRQRYPDVIVYGDISGLVSYDVHKAYVLAAQPDMVMSSWYPFEGGIVFPGGSPTSLYTKLQTWRRIGLEGLDGNGNQPIPYGYYFQTWVKDGRTPSQSEFNLEQFAAWAFGYKFLCAFIYSSNSDYSLTSILFNGLGDGSPTWAFYQMASLNSMSRKIGPALVRLISTDVRMKMGEHLLGNTCVGNTTPSGVSLWSTNADAYLKDVTATNLGTLNNGCRGDVVVGFFKPLHESFDGSNYSDQRYFMVVNGLTDPTGSMIACRQRIRLNFDFGSSGITSLQRMRRSDGAVETVNLISDGGSLYHLDLDLDGGIGDLFKYNTGAPFVGTISQIPGDANGDGMVDVGDLGILAANYGGSGKTWSQGDFNGDGQVDVGDLGILAANYGSSNFSADYARAFGTTEEEDVNDDAEDTASSVCNGFGLPLIAGLMMLGLLLVKLEAADVHFVV